METQKRFEIDAFSLLSDSTANQMREKIYDQKIFVTSQDYFIQPEKNWISDINSRINDFKTFGHKCDVIPT